MCKDIIKKWKVEKKCKKNASTFLFLLKKVKKSSNLQGQK